MKRVWSVCLSLFLVLCSVPTVSSAAIYDSTGFEYVKINDGTEAQIVAYHGIADELVIPETLGGLPVTSVAENGIYCEPGAPFTSITIPKYLKDFSAASLDGDNHLTEIILDEESMYFSLHDGVLYDYYGLKLVLYPAASEATEYTLYYRTQTVGTRAFHGAANLARIRLSDSLSTIEAATTNNAGAFEDCTALREISFPASVTTIGDYAFMGCSALAEARFVAVGTGLSIGNGAFLNCPSLKRVCLYDNLKSLGLESFGYVISYDEDENLVTSLVEDFSICSTLGGLADEYAKKWGIDFISLQVKSSWSPDVRVYAPSDAVASGEVFSASLTVDETLQEAVQAMTPYATFRHAIRLAFTDTEGAVREGALSAAVTYSLALPSGLSTKQTPYVFYQNAETGELVYVPAQICYALGVWGDMETRLVFDAPYCGTFYVINDATEFVGDVDADGAVTNSDLLVFAKRLAGWDEQANLFAMDVDGDGKAVNTDLLAFANYMAGWEVELLPFASAL